MSEVPVRVKKFSRSKVVEEPVEAPVEQPVEQPVKKGRKKKDREQVVENQVDVDVEPDEIDLFEATIKQKDNDFLKELTNQAVNKKKEEPKKEEKEKPVEKPLFFPPQFDDSIFANKKGEQPTKIMGKSSRQLLQKIHQYKELFPEELKNFKLKKNPNEQDLKDALQEMENIVECGTVESFLTDSILQCLKVVETVSSHTEKMNVTGMSEMLKANPQFHKLCKMLYVKYHVFSNIPPELQLTMLVATTAMVCRAKNANKGALDAFLNEAVN